MKTRTLLSVAALLVATAIPAIGSAQRYHRSYSNYGRTSYGHGPFYPSNMPGPSYQYFGTGQTYRSSGTTFYFGPGGGYYGNYPTYYPGYGYYNSLGGSGWDSYRPVHRRYHRSRR